MLFIWWYLDARVERAFNGQCGISLKHGDGADVIGSEVGVLLVLLRSFYRVDTLLIKEKRGRIRRKKRSGI